MNHPGIVDQDIQATEQLPRFIQHLGPLLFRSHIQLSCKCARTNIRGDFARARKIDVSDQNSMAALRGNPGGGRPYATGTAREEDGPGCAGLQSDSPSRQLLAGTVPLTAVFIKL